MLVAERGHGRFRSWAKSRKIGNHSQDTAELFFDDVRIPIANRMGEEGEAFGISRQTLPRNAFDCNHRRGVCASSAELNS